MRARAQPRRVELHRDLRLGVEAEGAALVEAEHEGGAARRVARLEAQATPRVPHPRAHAGARVVARRHAPPSSARSRARRARLRIARERKPPRGSRRVSGKKSGQARATIIQSRAAPRVDDLPAVKSPAESLNFRQSLLEFLEAGPGREEALLEEFERKKGQGDPLYSSLLYLLTHLNFTERQAARHWKRVVAHRERDARGALGRDPGLRVAILDYFVNVSHELRNPKVIEIAMYERTERSAVSDGLTGLYNHAYFLQALRQEVLRSKRHGLKAALLLLDLDDFKRVNDERGPRRGRPRAHEGGGDRARRRARDRRGRALRRRGVRGAAARHLAARGVRGGRADPAADRGALRPRPDAGHGLGRHRGLPRRRRARRPTSSCRRTRGSTARRPRARTASCSPRASAAASAGCRPPSASPSRRGGRAPPPASRTSPRAACS